MQLDESPPKWYSRILSKGAGLYLLSIVCQTLMAATSKLALEQVGNVQVTQIRTFLTGAAAIAVLKYNHHPIAEPNNRYLLLARGLLGFTNMTFMYYALQYIELPDFAAINFLVPLFAIAAAAVFLGEHIHHIQVVCSIVALLGVTVIARPPGLFGVHEDPQPHRLMAVFATLACVLGTVAATTILRQLRTSSAMQPVAAYGAVGTICATIVLLFKSGSLEGYPSNAREWAVVLATGVFGFLLQWFQSWALQLEDASYLVPLRYFSIIFATLWEFLLWGDLPDKVTLLGVAIVLASVIYGAKKHSTSEHD